MKPFTQNFVKPLARRLGGLVGAFAVGYGATASQAQMIESIAAMVILLGVDLVHSWANRRASE